MSNHDLENTRSSFCILKGPDYGHGPREEMSFDVNWKGLNDVTALETLKTTINARLKGLETGLVSGLVLEELLLPEEAPELTLEDLQSPNIEFYHRLGRAVSEESHDDLQISLRLRMRGSLTVVLRGELALNYPSSRFASLPLKICIKEISLNSNACI